ncbi:MAG: peptidoglycan D,D-transpeptidase FtsI family protein [Tepidisphaeraceae bacterium]
MTPIPSSPAAPPPSDDFVAPPSRTFSPRASVIILATVVVLFGALVGRVAYLQTYGRERTIRKAERQQHQNTILQARRGCIFDRNGMLMAGTVQTQNLFVDPKFMQDCFQAEGRSLIEMDEVIGRLGRIIDKEAFELSQLLGDRAESRYVKIAENLDDVTVREIQDLDLPGTGFTPGSIRYYPMGALGAHVLGGMGKDGGLEGLELKFEKTLAGKDGFVRQLKDARRRAIAVAAEDYLPPLHGQHLVLTLDANIQLIAEQELAAACEVVRAKRGEVIVMDPRTGEVLALANYPTFNPQNLDDSTADLRRNRCLTDPYEPGSTIKPFIIGPALAWDITRVGEVFPIHGPRYKSSLRSKSIVDVHGYEQLSTWDILVKSSNIGMTMIGERLGKDGVHRALRGFQFGQATGIELPGEDPGLLRTPGKWSNSDVVSAVQGYSVMVTPLQLARAFSAYANGGRLVDPRLTKGTLNIDGAVDSLVAQRKLDMMPEVLTPETATSVKRVLCDVVVRGTATKARSRTWNIFGKTGTAHISGNGQGYNNEQYTSSFIGGAPAESPRLVVAFVIHEPDRSIAHYGGTVSAPGASKLLERSLAYLQTPASSDLPLPPPHIADVLYSFDAKAYKRPAAPKELKPHAGASVSARD